MSFELTSEQLAAVTASERRVLCEAGAGSGKTGVLIERALLALCDEGCEPSEILAFTFTNKAAEELRERLRSELLERAADASGNEKQRLMELARDTDSIWFSTVHSFCRRVLAADPIAAGVDPGFRTIEESEALRLQAEASAVALDRISRDDPDRAAQLLAVTAPEEIGALARSAYLKLRSLGMIDPRLPEDPVSAGGKEPSRYQRDAYEFLAELVVATGEEYRRLKDARSGLDFDDLQLLAIRLLQADDGVGARYREQFSRILVDEFQDSGPLEIELIRALEGPDTSIFMVGDELQSIYRFRRADLRIFRAEREAHSDPERSDHAVKPLTGNFRSHSEILGLVNYMGKELLGSDYAPLTVGGTDEQLTDDGGPRVELLLTKADTGWNAALGRPDSASLADVAREAEAELLARRLAEVREERPDARIVILLRAATKLEPLRHALERFGLDPHFVSGRGFWASQEVGDLVAVLRVLANPTDDEALYALLASPACGVTPDTLWLLARDETGRSRHPYAALGLIGSGDEDASLAAIKSADREALLRTREAIGKARRISRAGGISETIEQATELLGYDLATLMRERGSERWANVRKLIRAAGDFESREGSDLRSFLDYCDLEREFSQEGEAPAASEAEAGVTVMTIHAAKGLQFDVVAVAQLGSNLGSRPRGPSLMLSTAPDDDQRIRVGLKLKAIDATDPDLFELSDLKQEDDGESLAEEMRLFHVAATRPKQLLILSGAYTPKVAVSAEDDRDKPTAKASIVDRLVSTLGLEEPASSGATSTTLDDAADAVEGSEAKPLRPRLGVTWNLPDAEALASSPSERRTEDVDRRALEKATEGLAARTAGRSAVASPMPSRLSFTKISTYERCPYRFFAERDLRLGSQAEAMGAVVSPGGETDAPPDELPPDDDHGELEPPDGEAGSTTDSRVTRYGPGNAVHRLLEWSARHDWRPPPKAVTERILTLEGLPTEGTSADRVRKLVAAWLESDLLARIQDESEGGAIHPEMPFLLGLDETSINGSMDLVSVSASGAVTLVDYKANALRGDDPTALMERYETQRDIYALALAGIAGASPIEVHYVFLESPGAPISARYDEAELAVARRRVTGILAGIADGEFPVTSHPHRGICRDCPASELCPHSEGDKDRESREPAVTVPETIGA